MKTDFSRAICLENIVVISLLSSHFDCEKTQVCRHYFRWADPTLSSDLHPYYATPTVLSDVASPYNWTEWFWCLSKFFFKQQKLCRTTKNFVYMWVRREELWSMRIDQPVHPCFICNFWLFVVILSREFFQRKLTYGEKHQSRLGVHRFISPQRVLNVCLKRCWLKTLFQLDWSSS